jgi:hypothetical protein
MNVPLIKVTSFLVLEFIEHLERLKVPLYLELQIVVMMVLDCVELARLVKVEIEGFLDQ